MPKGNFSNRQKGNDKRKNLGASRRKTKERTEILVCIMHCPFPHEWYKSYLIFNITGFFAPIIFRDAKIALDKRQHLLHESKENTERNLLTKKG